MTQESDDEEVDLSQGPFMRGEEEETKLEKTEKDMRNAEKNSKFSGGKWNIFSSWFE